MSQIIQTRYRDIPYEDIASCGKNNPATARDTWESRLRGKPVWAIAPPYSVSKEELTAHPRVSCGGPWYAVSNDPALMVCPHAAEIGD